MTKMCVVEPIRTPVDVMLAGMAVARCVVSPRRSAERVLDALVPAVVEAVLRRIDVTTLVTTHLDLEKVLATVDLPALIRESTGSMVSDSVDRARVRGVAADEAVRRLRARLLDRPARPH